MSRFLSLPLLAAAFVATAAHANPDTAVPATVHAITPTTGVGPLSPDSALPVERSTAHESLRLDEIECRAVGDSTTGSRLPGRPKPASDRYSSTATPTSVVISARQRPRPGGYHA